MILSMKKIINMIQVTSLSMTCQINMEEIKKKSNKTGKWVQLDIETTNKQPGKHYFRE